MKRKITLTEDHLALITQIHFEKFDFNYEADNGHIGWGIDKYSLFGGSYALEDVAMILGKLDQAIPESANDPTGRHFPQELEDYFWSLYDYIYENLLYIETLVHQFITKGGLTPGSYTCNVNDLIWSKEE